jgi:hypothetical protein
MINAKAETVAEKPAYRARFGATPSDVRARNGNTATMSARAQTG